ncbi:sigma-70 family RNA polymerase sigma factor [Jonesiaceae bacterium BS-20]|uniref:Sigma-70 family RNA polymerase sigma factor n=1 Tax=Jonesiaceae bacterium BS-20 TaxID=3120821 RepID=A0AAU7DZB4_9MICO
MNQSVEEFQTLFREHYTAILRYMERRVPDPADAEELAADVFRYAWASAEPAVRHPKAWLYAIARNTLLDSYRRSQRRLAALGRLERQSATEAVVEQGSQWEHPLHRILAQLPEPTQEILRLHYWEELETKEIGMVLGISPVNARVRLHRARTELKAHLNQNQSEGK